MLNAVSIYYCCCWSVVNECEKKCWKSVKFRYVFLPKEEGCSSSSSTTSSLGNFRFDDAGCFRVPVDVGFFLGLFGAGSWGYVVIVSFFHWCGGCMWFIILAALQFSNLCVDYSVFLTIFIYYGLWFHVMVHC